MTLTKRIFPLFACASILLMASSGQADPTLPTHHDARWQDIAEVLWSTDNGNTWGNQSLTVGQKVKFSFTMHKSYDGMHYADFLKSWIDWDDNEIFDATESVIFRKNVVHSTSKNNSGQGNLVNQTIPSFATAERLLTNDDIGTHWLLTRVTCSESLIAANQINASWELQWGATDGQFNNYFTSGVGLWQGEAELDKITVGAPVPEPATMLLFGAGIAGLAAVGRRKRS